jgi:hypothetical protein
MATSPSELATRAASAAAWADATCSAVGAPVAGLAVVVPAAVVVDV